jgi:hypothetical protein
LQYYDNKQTANKYIGRGPAGLARAAAALERLRGNRNTYKTTVLHQIGLWQMNEIKICEFPIHPSLDISHPDCL